MTAFGTVADLLACPQGTVLGHSAWRTLGQPRVDGFADATDDRQWIHVDRERAAAGPYGGTIAHGMLTLSLVPVMIGELASVRGATLGVNYGFDKVRFTHPVPVGSRVRAEVTVLEVTPVRGGAKARFRAVVEIEGTEKPACVAEQMIVWME